MKKRIKILGVIAIILIIAIVLSMTVFSNAVLILSSEKNIRKQLLKEIPIGTSMEDAQKILASHKKWNVKGPYSHGYYVNGNGHPLTGPNGKNVYLVGDQHICVYLGQVGISHATAYFAFNEESELVGIGIRKETTFY